MKIDAEQRPRAVPRLLSSLRLLWLLVAACGTYDDKRIRELYVEKGFGTRAQGNATREDYIGGLDRVQFLLPPELLVLPGFERLAELLAPQGVGLDGSIYVPYVGPVYALGMTEAELTALVKAQLRSAGLAFEVDLQARIVISRKLFYAIGETGRKGPVDMFPDLTLFDAMFLTAWTPLANLGSIYLIRPDAEHPLVMHVNFREMLVSGYTATNIEIRERDIIYVPPTLLGLIARMLQRLLEPLGLAVRTLLGAGQVIYAYDVLQGDAASPFFRF